jgi:hypothetical protein
MSASLLTTTSSTQPEWRVKEMAAVARNPRLGPISDDDKDALYLAAQPLESGEGYNDDIRIILARAFLRIHELESSLTARDDALASIRVFAQDCIENGHDRGHLGNLYSIRDLCDSKGEAK